MAALVHKKLLRTSIGAALFALVGVGIAPGCGSEETNAILDAVLDEDAGSDASSTGDSNEAGTAKPWDAGLECPSVWPPDCTGRCGPIRNPCTGQVVMCATKCEPVDGEARACDLATNTCIKPKVTCSELGAECGTVKDTCGNYLDCPDSPTKGCASAGQECDPDTRKCVDCQLDLSAPDKVKQACTSQGIECGFAWLGCGPNTPSNLTDCGSCTDPNRPNCNAKYNVCEPAPPSGGVPSAATLCAAAKEKRGVECGVISNGHGGTVNCDSVPGFGCKNGESCGVRGIANRCDSYATPDECKAVGQNCGTLTSACTGQAISCGQCQSPDVCNSNGVCGPPCSPKTCDDFKEFECGSFDDGCGKQISCGTCPDGVCDLATKSCCTTKTCADYPGQCGSALPNGCGQNTLVCNCASGKCTQNGGNTPAPAPGSAGQCCTPRTASYYTSQNQCGTQLSDGCGGTLNASCGSGKECVNNSTGAPGSSPPAGVVGTCCTRTDSCNSVASGACSDVQNSCRPAGTTTRCNKCVTPDTCTSVAGTLTCCQGAPSCGTNECNVTKTPVDPGCGSTRSCACSGGRVCMCGGAPCTPSDGAGVCTAALTCASPAYAGKCGTGLSNGVGGTISCSCGTGRVCSTASTPGSPPSSGGTGACVCNNPTGQPYTCSSPQYAGKCGTFDNGCGGTISCGCTGGQVCNNGTQTCCSPTFTCPTPGVGSACGSFTNGCNGNVSCGCPSGSGNENFSCSGGKCTCVPDTCRGRTGIQPDRCGGTLNCDG